MHEGKEHVLTSFLSVQFAMKSSILHHYVKYMGGPPSGLKQNQIVQVHTIYEHRSHEVR